MREREGAPKVERVPGGWEALPSEPENRLSTPFPGAPPRHDRERFPRTPGGPEGGGSRLCLKATC